MRLTARELTKEEQTQLVEALLTWVLRACKPKQVLLFGSAARQEMTEASDIDLVLVFADAKALSEARRDLSASAGSAPWAHDLLFHTPETFVKSLATGGGATWLAAREGKVIYTGGVAG